MIDLNDLALFHQVVRAGSFAEASRRLGVPSNTLSRRIEQFEAALDTRLLQRTTRKMALTDAGQALFDRSAGPVEDALAAVREIRDASPEPSGTVRVAVTADFFEFVPMEWVAQFLAAHPKVRIDFILSDDRTDLIADGIDVAFRAGELKDSSLIARRLYAAPLVLAASPAYLHARGMPCSLQDLATHDCITAGKPGRTLWHVNGESGHESVAVKGRFGANTAKSQITAARAGLGICLAPEPLVAPLLQNGTLVAVLPDLPQPKVDVFVVYPNRKHVPQAVSAFLEMTLSQLAATPWGRSAEALG
jgi:DNA-binding transcriptional LysR family regulator